MNPPPFKKFPSLARLSRECVITEKIDGTQSNILITEDGDFFTGSRYEWITPENDNLGFSAWAHENKNELFKLGVGHHFGEWHGWNINREYGLKERRFSLFNTIRWCLYGHEPQPISNTKMQDVLPECCGLVPVLYRGLFETDRVNDCLCTLKLEGSAAVPGFMNPEGVVCFHVAANVAFKKTLGGDGHKFQEKI